MNITILDGFAVNPGDLSWEIFDTLGNTTVYERTTPAQLHERAKDSEILLTNKTILTAEDLLKLPKLKYIGVLATGYNVVDVEEAHKRGIVVTNIPAYSTKSVAQHVFALLFAVTNSVEHYSEEVREGKWVESRDFCFWDTPLVELAGKTFGIVGLGSIGMTVAKIAADFGMKVAAFTSKEIEELPDGVEKVDFDKLLSVSDVLSLHCPLNDTTRHLINAATISKMKDGVILINTGRGPLVDEQAVADALRSGKIKAFCADVLSSEPPSPDNPLLSAPNTFITPHIAWATLEARSRLMNIAFNNVRNYLSGHPENMV